MGPRKGGRSVLCKRLCVSVQPQETRKNTKTRKPRKARKNAKNAKSTNKNAKITTIRVSHDKRKSPKPFEYSSVMATLSPWQPFPQARASGGGCSNDLTPPSQSNGSDFRTSPKYRIPVHGNPIIYNGPML